MREQATMSTSALFKVPIIVLYTYLWYKVMKPPQPVARREELRPTIAIDVASHSFWRVYRTIYTQVIFSTLEIGAILAANGFALPGWQWVSWTSGDYREDLQLSAYAITGVVFMALGALIRKFCYKAMGTFFRYHVSIQKGHQLIVGGPYSIVRHPSYTGLIFAITGWFLWNWSEGSWVRTCGILDSVSGVIFITFLTTVGILGVLAVTLGRMTCEDDLLRKTFGKEREDWAKRVPYSVFPGTW
ncbi:hypothetical protein CPC08DRAFT_549956 [Agrocybe pediades]|nr:hypothetical protein CPC08DRAFT_549956 [Agrocybe pediades]